MRKITFTIAMLFILMTWACAQSDRLIEAENNYRPPAYVMALDMRPSDNLPEESPAANFSPGRILSELKSQMDEKSGVPSFYQPESGLRQTVSSAAAHSRRAEQLISGRYNLDILEILAWTRSPEVAAAEQKVTAAVQGFSQIAALDAILFQYSAFTEALATGVGPMAPNAAAQAFPFPGVTALKGRIAKQNVRIARENLEIARRDAVTGARTAFWDLTYTYRAGDIIRRLLDLLDQLEAVAVARYETGRSNFQDVVKVRIRRRTLTEDLENLKQRRENLKTRIRELLDLPRQTAVGRPADTRPTQAALKDTLFYELALTHSQELQKLRARIEKTEYMLALAESMVLPSYSLGFSRFDDAAIRQVGPVASRKPFADRTLASRGAGLPKKPWYGTGDAYLKEMRYALAALRDTLASKEAERITMVRKRWFAYDRARREADLYGRRISDLTQAVLTVSTRGYEGGNVAFADVIDSHLLWLDTHLSFARKRSDAGAAWARLAQAVGVDLRASDFAQDSEASNEK